MTRYRLYFTAVVLAGLSPIVQAICYYPDGSIALQDTPCQDEDESAESACCGVGYACLSNNICQATGDEILRPGATEFVRGSCTDESWRSASCPAFCVNPDPPDEDLTSGGMGLAKCPDTTDDIYYCINSNTDNVDCDAKLNVYTFPGTPTPLTTIGILASSSTTTSSTTTSTTSHSSQGIDTASSSSLTQPTPTKEPEASTGPNTGAIAGGVVGGLALVAVIAGLVFFMKRKGKSTQSEWMGATNEAVPAKQHEYYKPPHGEGLMQGEGMQKVTELSGLGHRQAAPYELADS